MKKLNNKGFAIASILYSIMVLFLLLLLSILGILGNRKAILDKNKKDILEELNKEVLYNKINFEHKNITIINRGNLDDIRFALLDGVSAIDENGNAIGLDKINYNLDLNNIENKLYNVTYTVDRGNKIITATRQISFVPDSSDYIDNFDYTGDSQTFTTKYDGSYRVELWGASGGDMAGEAFDYENNSRGQLVYKGGNGAYTSGQINLSKGQNIYIYVGGKGCNNVMGVGGCETGGYNGGGVLIEGQSVFGSTGGGSTDIRITSGLWNDFDSLKSRIMVSAGGGGANFRNYGYGEGNGGEGGTLNGINGYEALTEGSYFRPDYYDGYLIGYGGAQTFGGYSVVHHLDGTIGESINDSAGVFSSLGHFGYATQYGHQSGGGSGYYGGGSSSHGGAGGGSSFISGYDGCDAIAESSTEDNIIHTGQSIHYSGYTFSNAVMYAGNESMPTHDGNSTMVGNSGNGYAKISLIYYYDDSQYKINIENNDIIIVNRGKIDDIKFALLDGITIKNDSNQIINNNNLKYNLNLNNIENKTYNVTYNIGSTSFSRQITFVPDSNDYIDTFDYTGDSQTFTTKYNGSYRVELWGAQGGGEYGGKGAYTYGNTKLTQNQTIYVYIGGQPSTVIESGYNGGGISNSDGRFGSGGGATDIRIYSGTWNNFDSLKSRIMVASGGGGGCTSCGINDTNLFGGVGGTLKGEDGYKAPTPSGSDEFVNIATGATQVSGGNSGNGTRTDLSCASDGSFGIGGNGGSCCIAAGGSGYYGGAGSGVSNSIGGSGSGGSSFISGYDGCDAIAESSTEDNIIHTGQSIHYSGYKFKNAVMHAGNESMPTHDGSGTMIGNSGNGFAKISLIYYY